MTQLYWIAFCLLALVGLVIVVVFFGGLLLLVCFTYEIVF